MSRRSCAVLRRGSRAAALRGIRRWRALVGYFSTLDTHEKAVREAGISADETRKVKSCKAKSCSVLVDQFRCIGCARWTNSGDGSFGEGALSFACDGCANTMLDLGYMKDVYSPHTSTDDDGSPLADD